MSQYIIIFEDFINEKIMFFINEKKSHFKIDENDGFMNQFAFNRLDEIIENLPGRIPILEYHIIETPFVYSNYILTKRITKNKKNERFFISSEEFRRHLEILYENGFRNISLDEYLSLMKGNVKDLKRIPPRSKLFVLTFDDATFGQFDFIEDGTNLIVDPDCAVGIMLDFARKNPDFKLNAAFCIDFENVPFLQSEYVGKKLNLLLDLGFELVNHTKSHKPLAKMLKKTNIIVDYEIGKAMEIFESYLGYRVTSINKICYPNGDDSQLLKDYVKKIKYNGREYNFIAALDAEGPLALNPNEETFDPYAIRRIEINKDSFFTCVINVKTIFKMPALVLKKSDIGKIVKTSLSNSFYLDLIKLP